MCSGSVAYLRIDFLLYKIYIGRTFKAIYYILIFEIQLPSLTQYHRSTIISCFSTILMVISYFGTQEAMSQINSKIYSFSDNLKM